AEALLASKSYSAALKDADLAVALNPGSAAAHYTRAKAKLGLRLALEKVYEDLYAAAHLDPAKYEEERRNFLKALPDPEKLASWPSSGFCPFGNLQTEKPQWIPSPVPNHPHPPSSQPRQLTIAASAVATKRRSS